MLNYFFYFLWFNVVQGPFLQCPLLFGNSMQSHFQKLIARYLNKFKFISDCNLLCGCVQLFWVECLWKVSIWTICIFFDIVRHLVEFYIIASLI